MFNSAELVSHYQLSVRAAERHAQLSAVAERKAQAKRARHDRRVRAVMVKAA